MLSDQPETNGYGSGLLFCKLLWTQVMHEQIWQMHLSSMSCMQSCVCHTQSTTFCIAWHLQVIMRRLGSTRCSWLEVDGLKGLQAPQDYRHNLTACTRVATGYPRYELHLHTPSALDWTVGRCSVYDATGCLRPQLQVCYGRGQQVTGSSAAPVQFTLVSPMIAS